MEMTTEQGALCCALTIRGTSDRSGDKSRRMSWAMVVEYMGEGRGVCRVFVWIPDRKRPLGRPRRRWEDNIKMDLQEVVCGSMDSG